VDGICEISDLQDLQDQILENPDRKKKILLLLSAKLVVLGVFTVTRLNRR